MKKFWKIKKFFYGGQKSEPINLTTEPNQSEPNQSEMTTDQPRQIGN